MFGRVDPLEAAHQPVGRLWRHELVETAAVMRIEVVLNQSDLDGCRIGLFQVLHEGGVLLGGPSGTDLNKPSACFRLDGQQHSSAPKALVFVVLFGDSPRFRWNRGHDVTDQEAGLLIEAQHGKTVVVGPRVHVQNAFHLAEEIRRQVRDAPLPFAVRLDRVFFRM